MRKCFQGSDMHGCARSRSFTAQCQLTLLVPWLHGDWWPQWMQLCTKYDSSICTPISVIRQLTTPVDTAASSDNLIHNIHHSRYYDRSCLLVRWLVFSFVRSFVRLFVSSWRRFRSLNTFYFCFAAVWPHQNLVCAHTSIWPLSLVHCPAYLSNEQLEIQHTICSSEHVKLVLFFSAMDDLLR